MNDIAVVWNVILTGFLGMLMLFVRTKLGEMDKTSALLAKTREEIAREHVTRAEYNASVERLGVRIDAAFNRLESKIDKINERIGDG